ncbi:Porin P precursor [Planctomycetes bacterium MalM25]|nr:Porin P precursor [Planctomycetes bacterium MalM25]
MLISILMTLSATASPAAVQPVRLPPPVESVDVAREIETLRQRIEQLEASAASPTAVPGGGEGGNEGGVELASHWRPVGWRSRYPTLRWNGFLQLDAGWISQGPDNIRAVGDVESKAGLRRVRLRVGGELRREVSYVVDLDFAASGHPSFRDVAFTLHEQGLLQNVQVGYFQQPFGFDAMTSGRELLLLERQLPFAFAPFRQTGVGAYGGAFDESVTWSFSGFRSPTDQFGVSQGDAGGWGFAERVTGVAFCDDRETKLVHLGGSFSFINPGTDTVRYAIEPGFFVVDPTDQNAASTIPAFVNTGRIETENVNLTGAELAAQWGSLNVQAETVGAFVHQTDGPFLGFYGVAGKLAYLLTGETHPYDRRRGVFDRIVPHREGSISDPFSGAWEAVAAWSIIDLNDRNIEGGRMQTLIVGVNRYLNEYAKFQLNLIRVYLDDPDEGSSAATLVALRAQVEF